MKKSRKGITLLTVVLVTVLSLACVFVGCDDENNDTNSSIPVYKCGEYGITQDTEDKMISAYCEQYKTDGDRYSFLGSNPFVCCFGAFEDMVVVGTGQAWTFGMAPHEEYLCDIQFCYYQYNIQVWHDKRFDPFFIAVQQGLFTKEQVESVNVKHRELYPEYYANEDN